MLRLELGLEARAAVLLRVGLPVLWRRLMASQLNIAWIRVNSVRIVEQLCLDGVHFYLIVCLN